MAQQFSNNKQDASTLIEFAELIRLIDALPKEHRVALRQALDQAMMTASRRRRILSFIQDAISQIRLDMKYLMFDLEATRRERDSYRQKLEESR
ncbi:MAG: transcriptional regulator [Thermoguttaceae bacterium]|nr:transcriptional regulator [Thermoguttaceae bacterium]